jgi:D-3-phosphoglycerate dehydrogenase
MNPTGRPLSPADVEARPEPLVPRILVTDWDQESLAEEEAVADLRGMELIRADCRTEEEVIRAAGGAAGLLVQYAPITRKVLEALPDLKAVGRYGVGVDNVDVEAATEFGVAVCNVPDYGTEDVSDHAVARRRPGRRAVSGTARSASIRCTRRGPSRRTGRQSYRSRR